MLKHIFVFLLTHFSVGLLFTILFISLKEIGKLYFRVTTLVACVLIVFALLAKPFGDIGFFSLFSGDTNLSQRLAYVFFLSTSILLIVYNIIHPRGHKPLIALSFILGILGISSYTVAIYQPLLLDSQMIALFVANGIGGTLILGSVLGAMITGHWYLVQHKLSLAPLKNSAIIYISSVLLRIVLIGLSILTFFKIKEGGELVDAILSLNSGGYIFIGRIVFGLIVPLVFGIMVWKSTKIRSTQSATGILYATIILVLMGETFGRVLFFLIGIPL